MIMQSFLNKLVGTDSDTAKKLCSKKGLKLRLMDDGVATILLAFPHTVNAWIKDDKVVAANAGDGLELFNDL